MIVGISDELFSNDAKFRELYSIILLCTLNERNKILIGSHAVFDSVNFKRFHKMDQDILNLQFVSLSRTVNDPDLKVTAVETNSTFSCEEALLYLLQPVSIILENSLNDRPFIEAIFKHFDDTNILEKHVNQNWITFDNAGGSGGIINIINGKFRSMASWPKKDKKGYLRCYVILDSDKLTSTTALKNDKQKVVEYLTRNNIKHHVLNKREMENYIPEATLLEIDDHYLNEYCKLATIQKDFFDLEKGLVTDRNSKNAKKEILDFYETISDKSWDILKVGIDCEDYNRGNFKSEFSKLFRKNTVNKTSLILRCGGTTYDNELLTIVNEIKSLL